MQRARRLVHLCQWAFHLRSLLPLQMWTNMQTAAGRVGQGDTIVPSANWRNSADEKWDPVKWEVERSEWQRERERAKVRAGCTLDLSLSPSFGSFLPFFSSATVVFRYGCLECHWCDPSCECEWAAWGDRDAAANTNPIQETTNDRVSLSLSLSLSLAANVRHFHCNCHLWSSVDYYHKWNANCLSCRQKSHSSRLFFPPPPLPEMCRHALLGFRSFKSSSTSPANSFYCCLFLLMSSYVSEKTVLPRCKSCFIFFPLPPLLLENSHSVLMKW